jgi:uncharacterized protein YceH (UPF0502 family)
MRQNVVAAGRLRRVDASPVELRVLGCLVEKQRTTPDQYPLSLNALRLACNQSTNRDPVMELDEHEIREALDRLGRRGWTRLASGPGSRAAKYRHLFDDALDLDDADISLLAVLMLRGPQTVAELRQRSERLHRFDSPPEVEETLRGLSARELVERQARRPGEREERWRQLLGDESSGTPAPLSARAEPGLEERVERLEAELAELRRLVDELR